VDLRFGSGSALKLPPWIQIRISIEGDPKHCNIKKLLYFFLFQVYLPAGKFNTLPPAAGRCGLRAYEEKVERYPVRLEGAVRQAVLGIQI
jgi:hypothetical protein